MRRRFSLVVRGLLLSALFVFTLTPCVALATDGTSSGQANDTDQPAITDTPGGEEGSGDSSTSTDGDQVTAGEDAGVNDGEHAGDADGTQVSPDTPAAPSTGTAPADSAEATAEDEDSDADTMTEEEFYSRFRGNSFRYADGEPISVYADRVSWKEQNGVFIGSNGMRVEGASGIGIDVSFAQKTINWAKVKSAGIDFAILRIGYGNGGGAEDDYFRANVKGCIENGIPFGVYFYTYTWDATTSRNAANWVLGVLEDCGLEPSDLALPVYFDMENQDPSTGKPAGVDTNDKYRPISGSTFAEMANAFCSTIENAGYKTGVYANLNWWESYLTSSTFNSWSRWVAQYNTTCDYTGSYDYWQAMSNGSVSGVSGSVDINFSYGDAFSLPAPELAGVESAHSGRVVSWSAVSGASGYAVYRKPAGGS
ncbi:GH25 family lysozyme, partial [Enorma sp.]|uniref:glycoside hydrolase family 25 protein n=1 Tax=Enorma sp. TaxID=1920692 RepID=UPI0025C18C73